MAEEFHFAFGTESPVRVGRDEYAERWPYRTKSPAWYAARQAHNIGCLNPKPWQEKPELYAWLKEVVSILIQPGLVERHQQELLTPDELEVVRREQADLDENGF